MKFSQDFRNRQLPELSEHLDTLENFYSLTNNISQNFKVDMKGVIQPDSNPMIFVGRSLWYLYAVHSAKFAECMAGIIRGASNGEYLILALCGRSIIEQTAGLRYMLNKLQNISKNAHNPNRFSAKEVDRIIEIVDKHVRGGRFNWERFWTSSKLELAQDILAADKSRSTLKLSQANPESTNAKTYIDD